MIDLHTHSTASDGSLTPSQLVQAASKIGITYLALTDHNTVNGLPEFLAEVNKTSIKAVPGIEITCELEKTKFHILALNLQEQYYRRMQSFVDDAANRSEMSKRTLVQNLQHAGYDIDFGEIKAKYPDGKINRSHIGRELVEKGYVATVSEAMGRLLSESAGYYQPAKRLNAIDVIHEITACEAIPVWAHPFLELDEGKVDYFLTRFVPEGLVGMEVYYSTYTDGQTESAKKLAEKYHLKLSGGSDFHGSPKPDIQVGIGRGNLNIPESIAEELLNADRNNQEKAERNMSIDKKEYLDMIQSEEYTNLYQYYMQDTYLDILGVARQENPHSSFIRWLLDPTGSHGLGDFPLRKMIETLLLAKEKLNDGRFAEIENSSDKDNRLVNLCSPRVDQSFLEALLFGNYILSDVEVFRELCLAGQRRADIFVSFKVFSGEVSYPCILLIENKIKSAEHDNQTENYFDDINDAVQSENSEHNTLRNVLKDQCRFPLDNGSSQKIYSFFVYLTADRSSVIKEEIQNDKRNLCPTSKEFLWMNYQYLLDGVLEPCLKYSTTELTKQRISEYIRCLGQDSKLGDITLTAEDAKSANDMYLIMAVSSREKQWALKLLSDHEEIIEKIFTSLVKDTNPFGAKEEKFWNCVANLYLIILKAEDKYQNLVESAKKAVNTRSGRKLVFEFEGELYRMKAKPNNFARLCRNVIEWAAIRSGSERWDEKKVTEFRNNFWKGRVITNWTSELLVFEDEKGDKETFERYFFSDGIKVGATSFYVAKSWSLSEYPILMEALEKMGCKDVPVKSCSDL